MLRFYYNPGYKYTNRTIIDISTDTNYREIDYANIDSPDTINGHIIYQLEALETIPTYIYDTETTRRYFVSGITQLRTGKYQISLLRDIISENPTIWSNERAYISAGLATDYNKYKRWDLPFTNTKVSQQRLPINGKSSFFVFYVNEQSISSNVISENDLQIKYTGVPGYTEFDYTVSNLSDIPNFEIVDAGNVNCWTDHKGYIDTVMDSSVDPNNVYPNIYRWRYSSSVPAFYNELIYYVPSIPYVIIPTMVSQVEQNVNGCKTAFETAIKNFISNKESQEGYQITTSQYNSLAQYVNKVIYDTNTSKIYTIRLRESTSSIYTNGTASERSSLVSTLSNINFPARPAMGDSIETHLSNWITVLSERKICSYTLEELGAVTQFDFNFKANTRKLPKSAVRCVNIVSDSSHTDSEIAQCLMLAQTNGGVGIGDNSSLTTGRILDIQYLPFSLADSSNTNFVINTNEYLTASPVEIDDFEYFTNLTDLTNINKETDTIKIVSPSRASQYLFRPYDNDGNMEFTTKITLKPYTSSIYVRPSTRGLLQQDWDDKDCLIIQEDFSLTNVSSEWAQYIYQNRTYLNAFERQMQGREYERSWERRVETERAKSDEWNARNISAQKAQTYTGNIPIISGIAGAIGTSVVDEKYMAAAALDREYNEALYQEGLSLSRDLFNYQLENIKSQPLIPSKVTTIDCKFLDGVYLEFYSTNPTELNAIASFYANNGNRIDDYGTFSDYWGPFVRGRIIISLNYTQPEVNELNKRLGMGIYTGGIL